MRSARLAPSGECSSRGDYCEGEVCPRAPAAELEEARNEGRGRVPDAVGAARLGPPPDPDPRPDGKTKHTEESDEGGTRAAAAQRRRDDKAGDEATASVEREEIDCSH
jgi:hypothetical protein